MIARISYCLGVLFLALVVSPVASAETVFEVIHKKRFQPDGKGVLRIVDDEIRFEAADEKHSRRWAYRDIRFLDRVGPTEIILHSYENARFRLGRDKLFHFVMTAGELTVERFNHISAKIGKPGANRAFVAPERPDYEISVKHRHPFGGCQGRLLFTESRIFYQAGDAGHGRESREWMLARDVESVWSTDPYHLELHVYEGERRRSGRTRIFRFDLKRKLDEEFLRELKLRLYRLNTRPPSRVQGATLCPRKSRRSGAAKRRLEYSPGWSRRRNLGWNSHPGGSPEAAGGTPPTPILIALGSIHGLTETDCFNA